MAMRWLTRDWQTGALPDDEHASRWQTYLEHRDTTAIHLPPALHRLAAVDVDGALTLHRAVPDWWSVEPDKALTLSVITGDDTHAPNDGPQRIVLQYVGHLEVDGASAEEVDAWLAHPEARLLYDEIEVLPGRRFEQRFLLAPEGELTVRFDNVLLVAAPTAQAEREALITRRTASAAATAREEQPEGSPAPLPATTGPGHGTPRKRSLRDVLPNWLPGVRRAPQP